MRDLSLGSQGIYGLLDAPVATSKQVGLGAAELFRLNPATNQVTHTLAVPGAAADEVSGGTVWVLVEPGNQQSCVSGPVMLDRFDPVSLQLLQRITLPGAQSTGCAALLPRASSQELWAAAGNRLFGIDSTNGQVVKSIPLSATVKALAPAKAGPLIYVATAAGGNPTGATNISQLNTVNGHALVSKSQAGSGDFRLSASSSGVWVSTLNTTYLLRASDLARVKLANSKIRIPALRAGGAVTGQSIKAPSALIADVSSGLLWLQTAGHVVCADASSGLMRASSATNNSNTGPIIAVSNHLYLPTSTGINEMSAPAACFS